MCFPFLDIFGTQSQDVVSVSVSVLPDLAPICKVIFLLGHWNHEGLGCSKRMSVPEIRAALLQIPGCSGFGRRPKKDLNVLYLFHQQSICQKTKRSNYYVVKKCQKMIFPNFDML